MDDKQTICMITKQDSETSSSAEMTECDAVRRFRSCNDRVQLVKDFIKMIKDDNTSVAELESVIDICPDILTLSSNYRHTPLHKACCQGRSIEVVELLVRRNPGVLQIADSRGNLPLHKVQDSYQLSAVMLMVDTYPLSVQVQNIRGLTPLHFACTRKCSFQVIEFLVQLYPQALQMKDDLHGYTPLHIASSRIYSNEVIELLVRQSPDVLQVADSKGNLPLHYRCANKRCELSVIKLMVDAYPLSVQVQNMKGQTPLFCACHTQCSIPVIEYLAQLYPQALQIKDRNGCTPFFMACVTHMDLSVIQLLHTAFPLAARWKIRDGRMPLAVACNGGSMEVIEFLAYKCWPVACPLLYTSNKSCDAKTKKCLEDATFEAVAALIDVAFHVNHILPVTVKAHITWSVMPCFDKNLIMKLPTSLSPGQHCELILHTLNHHANLDRSMLFSILKGEEIQCLLRPEGGHDKLQELIDIVIQMNRGGRAYITKDLENQQQGMKVLQITTTNLSGLFYHIRENPLLCKQQ